MTTRLLLYNNALMMAGESAIASLTEARQPRYLLDNIWDNGGVKACLERGQWKFAIRTIMSDYDSDITPEFGYQRAHAKPSDWCITSTISADEYFNTPLLQIVDENGYWWTDEDTIYIRYISDDTAWGNDLSLWPSAFGDYVASYFARKLVYVLTSDKDRRREAVRDEREYLKVAKNVDAINDPPKFPPEGSWNRSRRGSSRAERGNRNQLIG